MVRKSYSPEQIINKLREAEIMLSQGASLAVIWKKIGVSDCTYLPPTPETAKDFLVQFVDRKPRTLARYAKMIKSLPPYTEDSDIDRLLEAFGNKRGCKATIQRDRLIEAMLEVTVMPE